MSPSIMMALECKLGAFNSFKSYVKDHIEQLGQNMEE